MELLISSDFLIILHLESLEQQQQQQNTKTLSIFQNEYLKFNQNIN